MPRRDVKFTVYFCENLDWMCRLSGIYRTVLSELLGYNKQHITCLVSGKYFPSLECVAKIADYFDVTVDYMLSKHDWSVYKKWPV